MPPFGQVDRRTAGQLDNWKGTQVDRQTGRQVDNWTSEYVDQYKERNYVSAAKLGSS